MTKQTFTVTLIDTATLGALDLREEAAVCNEALAFRITIYDHLGLNPEAETAQALFCPPYGPDGRGPSWGYGSYGRLGIAWGADATWADADSIDGGIDMWLNDPEEWEARN